MSLKLHRACKVIGFTQMEGGWPQAFHLEQIAKLQFPDSASDEAVFYRALKSDCMGGSLKHRVDIEHRRHELSPFNGDDYRARIREYVRDRPYEVTVYYVSACDLAAWLEKQGERPSAHLAAWIETQTPETQAPPVVTESASGGVELDKAGPLPVEQGLLTKDIAVCFGDCYYSTDNWPKRLSGTAWLKTARIGRGEIGGASAVWNPLTLAQLMHDKTKGEREKETLMKALNSRFTLNPALGPWRDAFNEYYATYCATD